MDVAEDTATGTIDARTVHALGERVAAVETKVGFLQTVVDKISNNIHGMNQELMKIQIGTGRNSDALDTVKIGMVERGVQLDALRTEISNQFQTARAERIAHDKEMAATVAARLAEVKSDQTIQHEKMAAAVNALSERRFLLEGAWGATVRLGATFVAVVSVLGTIGGIVAWGLGHLSLR